MKWFDSISEKWIVTRDPEATAVEVPAPEDDHARGARLVREANIWAAVVASATSSCISVSRNQENDKCSESAKP